jgi:hypothetical protein
MEIQAQVIQRWRDLRTMLINQLDMFETGALTLRSNGVNISAEAITDLKRSILEFDALTPRVRPTRTPTIRDCSGHDNESWRPELRRRPPRRRSGSPQ